MGVPGLHSYLFPYGSNVSFNINDPFEKSLIIDGPALAYHVWKQESCYEGSYRKYKRALILFMGHLTGVAKFDIKVIYFDGYLPPHKREIRLKRAYANLQRVKKNCGSLIHSTPPSPFVVSLTQDVLRKLGLPVIIASEEADIACARETLKRSVHSRSYLMSLDSDLHCFDLGKGHYLPLDSFTCTGSTSSARAYHFGTTQKLIGVDLLELATVVGTEGSSECPRQVSEAHSLLKANELQALVPLEEINRVKVQFYIKKGATTERNKMNSGSALYGRIQEATATGEVWLPQLLEDHTQASAWRLGVSHRAAAYLALGQSNMIEYIRRSESITGKPINVDDPTLRKVENTKESIFCEALTLLYGDMAQEGKAVDVALFGAFVVQLIGTFSERVEETTKDILHITARYQATVFSIVMHLQAQGHLHVPDISAMYDLPTFLTALKFLRAGHSLRKLAPGKEEEIDQILSSLTWYTDLKAVRRKD